jgi:hypothetical protein
LTTERQRRANRANTKGSTGPKTKVGETRSSKNALRHGLNIPIWSDPAFAPQADAIARRIAGQDASDERLEKARHIGAAQIDLIRIRVRRKELMDRLLEDPDNQPKSANKRQLSVIRLIEKYGSRV